MDPSKATKSNSKPTLQECATSDECRTYTHEQIFKERTRLCNAHVQYPFSLRSTVSSPGDFTLCHIEPNKKDDVYQEGRDILLLRYTDFLGHSNYAPLGAKTTWGDFVGFPDFRGQNLSKWHKARQKLFSEEAPTVEEHEQFSSIVNYCQKNGIDLQEGVEVALQIREGAFNPHALEQRTSFHLSPEERVYALMIASLLLGLRKNTSSPFYRAHKDFIDTVFVKIKEGKLNLGKVNEDKPDSHSPKAEYYPETNSIFFIRNLSTTTPDDLRTILHELYHFYQDIRKESPMRVPREVDAYLLEAEWWLQQKPGLLEDEGKMMEFQQKISPESFYRHSLPAAYYRLKGNLRKSDQYRTALADHLAEFFLSADFKTYQPDTLKLMEETDRKIAKIQDSKQRLQKIENLYRTHHKLFIKEHKNYLRLEKASSKNDKTSQVNALIFLAQALIFLDQLKSKILKGIYPNAYPSRFEFSFNQLRPTTQKAYKDLFLLKPKATAYGHPFDGVG